MDRSVDSPRAQLKYKYRGSSVGREQRGQKQRKKAKEYMFAATGNVNSETFFFKSPTSSRCGLLWITPTRSLHHHPLPCIWSFGASIHDLQCMDASLLPYPKQEIPRSTLSTCSRRCPSRSVYTDPLHLTCGTCRCINHICQDAARPCSTACSLACFLVAITAILR